MCFFVIVLLHSGWYPQDPSICLRHGSRVVSESSTSVPAGSRKGRWQWAWFELLKVQLKLYASSKKAIPTSTRSEPPNRTTLDGPNGSHFHSKHHKLSEWLKPIKQVTVYTGEDLEEGEHSFIADGNANNMATLEISFVVPQYYSIGPTSKSSSWSSFQKCFIFTFI